MFACDQKLGLNASSRAAKVEAVVPRSMRRHRRKSTEQAAEAHAALNRLILNAIDPTGAIKLVVESLYPESETPYRIVESLINKGVIVLAEILEESGKLDVDSVLNSAHKINNSSS